MNRIPIAIPRTAWIEPLESRIAPAGIEILETAMLNGHNGFEIEGPAIAEGFGARLSSAGDINGDGFDDFIIGDERQSTHPNDYPKAHVIFGSGDVHLEAIDVSSLDGANGFAIDLPGSANFTAISVAGVGDVNEDGLDDIMVGSRAANANGASYVVFGRATAFPPLLDVTTLNGSNGFSIVGESTDDQFGTSVGSAGDVNGDNINDLIIGAIGAGSGTLVGSAYVIYGRSTPFPSELNVGTLTQTDGFEIHGYADYDRVGNSVSGAGDVNRDGYSDILIAVSEPVPTGGVACVIFGGPNIPSDVYLRGLTGNNGFRIIGLAPGNPASLMVSDAGDLNGDGCSDILIGAPTTGAEGLRDRGAAYVVFGKTQAFASEINVSALNGTNGFAIDGPQANERLGSSVSAAGDLNADGLGDIVISAPGIDVGRAVVILGKTSPFAPIFDLETLSGTAGFVIHGATMHDHAGGAVSRAGDVNGDGYADLVVAAEIGTSGDFRNRAVYVIFGTADLPDNPPTISALPDRIIPPGSITGPIPFIVGDRESVPGLLEVSVVSSNLLAFPAEGLTLQGSGANRTLTISPKPNISGTATITVTVSDGRLTTSEEFTVSSGGQGATIDALTLNGVNGFSIESVPGGTGSYVNVSAAGDVNGDGISDFLLSVPSAGNQQNAGITYLLFGKIGESASQFDLSTVDGANGFQVIGQSADDRLGLQIGSAGDINRDGFDDLILGASSADTNGVDSGACYIILGKASAFAATLDLAALDGTNGFRIDGPAAGEMFGSSVSSAGDLNADGFDDMVIGAPASQNSLSSGSAWVIFGKASGFSAVTQSALLPQSEGFRITGTGLGRQLGVSVSKSGDFNHDGRADIIVGLPQHALPGMRFGASYVIYGKADPFPSIFDIAQAADGAGVMLLGAGNGVNGAGDLNGDQISDVVIETSGFERYTYVVYGGRGNSDAFDILQLNGSNGFGLLSGGSSVQGPSGNGDFNGDGIDDLVIGRPDGVSVVFGASGARAGMLNLSTLNGLDGFTIPRGHQEAQSLSIIGDVNGDGFGDLAIGVANDNFPPGTDKPLVLFGFDNSVQQVELFINLTGADVVMPGESVVHTLDFGNLGNVLAPGVVLTQGLSPGMSFDPAKSSEGWAESPVGSGVYKLALGELSAGQLGSRSFAVLVTPALPAALHSTIISASIGYDGSLGSEPLTENNLDSANIIFDATPVLKLSVVDHGLGFSPSGKLIYTLKYENAGNQAATGVSLHATLPSNVVLVDADTGAELPPASSPFPVQLGELAAGATGSLSFAVRLTTVPVEGVFDVTINASIKDDFANGGGGLQNYFVTHHTPILTFAKGGRAVSFHDADGDLVRCTTTRGQFLPEHFSFVSDLRGPKLASINLSGEREFEKSSITLTSDKVAGSSGDGFVDITTLNAAGIDLRSVNIDGGLGFIFAGDGDSFHPALKSLKCRSLGGQNGSEAETFTSTILGSVGQIAIKSDWRNATVSATLFGTILVGGAVSNGAILASGLPQGKNPIALKSAKFGGSVEHFRILAGYDATGLPVNADVQIGAVHVDGDWVASDIVAGIDATNDYFGDESDSVIPGGDPQVVSRIAGVIIKGAVSGSMAPGDHFGFVAESIGSAMIGANKIALNRSKNTIALDSDAKFREI